MAERKWVAPSYLSKNTTKSTFFLSTLTFLSSTPSKRDAPSYLSKNNTKSTLFCQPRFFRRRRCEMCSRSGTRRTSRRDAWPTLSGTSRLTWQKPIQRRRVFRHPRFSRRRRCKTRGTTGTRRTLRRDAWPTLRGTPRLTYQKTIQRRTSTFFLSPSILASSATRNV